MEIVSSSFLALAAILGLVLLGPVRGMWIFFAMMPFGAAAAINLPAAGGASILPADLCALAIFALVWLRPGGASDIAGSMRIGQPGFWLLLLAVYSVIATLFFPALFRGATEVFSIARKEGEIGIVSTPLRPSTGNLTQLFRLMLGCATFFALATVFRQKATVATAITAVAWGTAVNVALGWLDVGTAAVGMGDAMEWLRSANYSMLNEATMVGLKRMVGGFPEASAFGYFALGVFAFWLQFWVATPRSKLAVAMLVISAVAVLRSTSSAAYVALVVFLPVFAVTTLFSNLGARVDRRGTGIALAGVIGVLLAVVGIAAAYAFVPPVTEFLDDTLFNKLDSDSGVERMSWNSQAWINFIDTRLLGAGLGSVRASSWLMATLGSLGVIGTLFFLAFVLQILFGIIGRKGNAPDEVTIRSLRAACLIILIAALLTVPTPDLGIPFFAYAGLAAGLARRAILSHKAAAGPAAHAEPADNPAPRPRLSVRQRRNDAGAVTSVSKS